MSDPPIFIYGITGRSGTNFVRDLLVRHPDCAQGRPEIWEDFFIDESDPLFAYANSLARRWRAWVAGDPTPELMAELGRGLITFLSAGRAGRIVTKTPSVRNLGRFFRLFPEAKLLVLVRDPRSVAASAERSFDADYEGWARQWARHGRIILDFDQAWRATRGADYAIVHYEDLVVDTEGTLRKIFATLELDPERYDFEAAAALPARGSSQLAASGDVHWKPVQRDADFDPLRRWRDWPEAKLRRIAWLTAPVAEQLGYDLGEPPHGFESAAHHARDARLTARLATRGARRRLRRLSSGRRRAAGRERG